MTDTMIKRAETAKLISKPSFAKFPNDAPIHVAFRLIELRPGTQPPVGAMARRIAFGTARSAEEAARLAGFEAIERYALQFSCEASVRCESFIASDDGVHAIDRSQLALGAPETNGEVTSKGAAAGQTIDAAAISAVCECLEHALDAQDAYSHRLPAEALPKDLSTWLAGHLRQLEVHVVQADCAGLLLRAVCADLDGGRPTYGTALSADLRRGVWRAAGEAVVSWRNMVTLDHKGVTPSDMHADEARFFQLYRGARSDRPAAPEALFDHTTWRSASPVLAEVLTFAQKTLGRPIAVFEMTAPELPLPVVKAVPVLPAHKGYAPRSTKIDCPG